VYGVNKMKERIAPRTGVGGDEVAPPMRGTEPRECGLLPEPKKKVRIVRASQWFKDEPDTTSN
jgi:hypothetical protein